MASVRQVVCHLSRHKNRLIRHARVIHPRYKRLENIFLINNRWTARETGKTFATISPSTSEEICQVSEADATDVEKAVKAARTAFELGPWRKTRASERGRLLHRLADLIEDNADDLASLE